jgi:DNA-binding beta-propeller fold protein YncE
MNILKLSLLGFVLAMLTTHTVVSQVDEYTFVREFGEPGTQSNQFWFMDGIAVDRFGTVFITDSMVDIDIGYTGTFPCVKRWSVEGEYEHWWLNHGNDFEWIPGGIDCSCDGDPFYSAPVLEMYTFPYGANIEHTTPGGVLYEKFPPAVQRLPFWCRDVAVSADGFVYGIFYFSYQTEGTNLILASVWKFEWTGTNWFALASAVVTNEHGLSAAPWGIDADPWRRQVYVTLLSGPNGTGGLKVYDMELNQVGNHRLWNYTAMPSGVAVDNRNGTFLITEAVSNRIYKYTAAGDPVLSFGGPGTAPYEFSLPMDLDVDMNGWLYVADAGNDRVQVFAPPKEGNLNFLVYKSKVKVGWKQKVKGKNRDIILCKAWAALDPYTNITSMIGMPFSFSCNSLAIIPEMLPTKTNKKGNKALYKPDKDHKAKVQYRTKGAQLRLTVKHKRGNIDAPLGIVDTTPLPPWLWVTARMTLTNEYLGIHYMRLEHKNKPGKVYKAWKK